MEETFEHVMLKCVGCGALIDRGQEQPAARLHCPTCAAAMRVRRDSEQFRLEAVLGAAGRSAVYRARDTKLNRLVALKLLGSEHAGPELIQSFAAEAVITGSITDPHVVKVYSTGNDHEVFYIAMELMEKGSLDDLMEQGPVDEALILEVAIQIAEGLKAAYRNGLIHGDVKPGNILFADAHSAKIVGFRLPVLQTNATYVADEVSGMPYYVAPEKLETPPREDFRSDMYSLGATLFHALAGRPPFEARTASMLALKRRNRRSVSLQTFAPHVSGETAYVINRMLLKNPNERYQSYDELIEHLQYAAQQLEEEANRPNATKRLVIGGEADKAISRLWRAVVALILMACFGALLFGEELIKARRKPATPIGNATATVSAAGSYLFLDARKKLLNGDAAGAAALYRQHAMNAKLSFTAHCWAAIGEGLAHYIADQPVKAHATFRALAERPAPTDADQPAIFLTDLARKLADDDTDAAEAKDFDTRNHEAIGLLLFGLDNWHQGRGDKAAALFRQFRSAKPTGADAWIDQLKPLANPLMESYAEFQMNQAKARSSAISPEKRAKAVEALRNQKHPILSDLMEH